MSATPRVDSLCDECRRLLSAPSEDRIFDPASLAIELIVIPILLGFGIHFGAEAVLSKERKREWEEALNKVREEGAAQAAEAWKQIKLQLEQTLKELKNPPNAVQVSAARDEIQKILEDDDMPADVAAEYSHKIVQAFLTRLGFPGAGGPGSA